MTNKKILTLISLLLVSFLLVGCFPNRPPEITSFPVETAIVGEDYTYNVVATDPDRDVLTYSLITEPSGMVINGTSGVITWTPAAAGDFDVTVEVSDEGGLSDSQDFTITVKEFKLELTGIEVDPKTMTLFAGESKTITSVTATYEIRGYEIPIALGECTYTSSATGFATVSDTGVVTAVAEGTAAITVGYGGKTDTLEVTVSAAELDHIVVLPETMPLFVGESKPITSVTAYYSDGSAAGIVLGDCTYLSSDEEVATVVDGVISALTPGTATITITYADMTDILEVTISAVEPEPKIELTGIVVVPKTMTLFAGESKTITSVTATYEIRGYEIPIALGECTYTSSATEFATVSDAGLVTAVAKGVAIITVGYGGETDTLEVTVNPVLLTSIVVEPKVMDLIAGGDFGTDTDTITSVTAYYNDGSEDDTIDFADCTFASDDKTSATVSATGVVVAVAEGTATITVSYADMTDTLEVTVGAVELDHIVVLPEEMTLYYKEESVESGSQAIKSITAHYNDGTKVEVDFVDDCTYGLNPMGIVTVDDTTGLVTATATGKTTITITYKGKTDTIGVTVLAFELDYIVVEPEEMTLYKGEESKTITSVFAHYNDGTKAEIGLAACEYESSDEDVATVAIGVVTATTPAVGSGEATITVSYEEGEVTAEDFVAVTVENRAPILGLLPINEKAFVGTPYTCTISAIDPDDWDVLTYFLDTLIIGMNIGPENGNINWMPLSTDSGEVVTVDVRVSDGELSDTGSFDITVTGL